MRLQQAVLPAIRARLPVSPECQLALSSFLKSLRSRGTAEVDPA